MNLLFSSKRILLLVFRAFILPLGILWPGISSAQHSLMHHLPTGIPIMTSSLPSLEDCRSADLESLLQKTINAQPEWKALARSGKMAVGVVDLRKTDQARFAQLNGNKMMYAASLPKIAVLLAAMDAVEKGELKLSKEVVYDCNRMIRYSDNQASTRMIDRVGFEKIECVLTDPINSLYDPDCGGGLWCGKRYGAGGGRHPDPIKGLSHGATAMQVCRFYYKLAFGQLINEDRSRQMLEFLVDPGLHHKFVNTLQYKAPQAKFFRKSGSWKNYHSDSIMVWGPKRRYILVALLEAPNGEQILRKLAGSVDRMMSTGA